MKLIDVAIFGFPNDASILESILIAEGIEYSLNNQASAFFAPGTGSRLSVREKDLERVIVLIKEAGFEKNLLQD